MLNKKIKFRSIHIITFSKEIFIKYKKKREIFLLHIDLYILIEILKY